MPFEKNQIYLYIDCKIGKSLMRHIIIIVFLWASISSFCQTKHELDSLTHVLEQISVDDQKYRLIWDSTIHQFGMNSPEFIDLIKKMNLQDSVNMLLVGNILDRFGWLSKDETSEDANDALFLVIQHASLQSQLKYLGLMKQAVSDKKAKTTDYALLIDRTKMYQGEFQVYGSQLNYDTKGNLHIFPIIDEANVNKRRKLVGLPSMQEYVKLFNQTLSYTLPISDQYKNKIVIRGSITGKNDNQPVPNVSVFSINNQLLGMADSSGFFQVLIAEKNRNQKIIFKKKYYESSEFKLTDFRKKVIEINSVLTKK